MLTITQAQLRKLDEASAARFADALAAHMRDRYGDVVSDLSSDELLAFCRRSVERGRAFGLDAARDLRILAEVGLILGERCFSLPTVRMTLSHPDISADEKVGFLLATAEQLVGRGDVA